MRRSTVMLLVVTVAVIAGTSVAIWLMVDSDPQHLSVEEYLQLDELPRGEVILTGRYDPESVVETIGTVSFDLVGEERSKRATVVIDQSRAGDLPYCVVDMVVNVARIEDGSVRSHDVWWDRNAGPYRMTDSETPTAAPTDFNPLSLSAKGPQIDALLGRDVALESAEFQGLAVSPASQIEIYRDDEGLLRVWNGALNTWVGTLPENIDQTPGRVYPGEASLEECMERADALAEEYYTGDVDTFYQLRRTWNRRVQEQMGAEWPTIISYDVHYRRYLQGIELPDEISVTVYALSGGSDFVGIQRAEEITWTVEPRLSAIGADRAAREATRFEQPERAVLLGAQLVVWNNRLEWHLSYDWNPEPLPQGAVSMCDHTETTIVVDAMSGKVMPFRPHLGGTVAPMEAWESASLAQ